MSYRHPSNVANAQPKRVTHGTVTMATKLRRRNKRFYRVLFTVFILVTFKVVKDTLNMATVEVREVDKAIRKLQEIGINLLAIDFDQTIIDIHTGGRWKKTMDELKIHVRPQFRELLTASIEHDIHVAVVTFSKQPTLIKEILETIVGIENAARIPVRGNDHSWQYHGVGSRHGKQAHIASAVEELEQSGEVEITKKTTLLIDDDDRNIRHALRDGTRGILFNPNKPGNLMGDLANLV